MFRGPVDDLVEGPVAELHDKKEIRGLHTRADKAHHLRRRRDSPHGVARTTRTFGWLSSDMTSSSSMYLKRTTRINARASLPKTPENALLLERLVDLGIEERLQRHLRMATGLPSRRTRHGLGGTHGVPAEPAAVDQRNAAAADLIAELDFVECDVLPALLRHPRVDQRVDVLPSACAVATVDDGVSRVL